MQPKSSKIKAPKIQTIKQVFPDVKQKKHGYSQIMFMCRVVHQEVNEWSQLCAWFIPKIPLRSCLLTALEVESTKNKHLSTADVWRLNPEKKTG